MASTYIVYDKILYFGFRICINIYIYSYILYMICSCTNVRLNIDHIIWNDYNIVVHETKIENELKMQGNKTM